MVEAVEVVVVGVDVDVFGTEEVEEEAVDEAVEDEDPLVELAELFTELVLPTDCEGPTALLLDDASVGKVWEA